MFRIKESRNLSHSIKYLLVAVHWVNLKTSWSGIFIVYTARGYAPKRYLYFFAENNRGKEKITYIFPRRIAKHQQKQYGNIQVFHTKIIKKYFFVYTANVFCMD